MNSKPSTLDIQKALSMLAICQQDIPLTLDKVNQAASSQLRVAIAEKHHVDRSASDQKIKGINAAKVLLRVHFDEVNQHPHLFQFEHPAPQPTPKPQSKPQPQHPQQPQPAPQPKPQFNPEAKPKPYPNSKPEPKERPWHTKEPFPFTVWDRVFWDWLFLHWKLQWKCRWNRINTVLSLWVLRFQSLFRMVLGIGFLVMMMCIGVFVLFSFPLSPDDLLPISWIYSTSQTSMQNETQHYRPPQPSPVMVPDQSSQQAAPHGYLRVHSSPPGEWIMRLHSNGWPYTFQTPMINPQKVVCGQYDCTLTIPSWNKKVTLTLEIKPDKVLIVQANFKTGIINHYYKEIVL